MAIPDFEQRSSNVNRTGERSAGDEFFVGHVAAVDAGWCAADASVGLGRSHAHAAEERMQRNLDSRSETASHTLTMEGNDLGARVGEVLRQEACAEAEAVICVRN